MDRHDAAGIDAEPKIYQCESCGGIGFGEVSDIRCCGSPMTVVDPAAVNIDLPKPKFDRVLQTVFGLPLTSLEIIHWLMDRDETKARELTDALGYDRSTITRNLDALTDIGLVERRPKTRNKGGRVYFYSVGSNQELRQQFRRGLYVWVTYVLQSIDEFVPEQHEN